MLAGLRRDRPALCRAGIAADRRKKRLIALAEWHFGGGDGYCSACPKTCAECPYVLNAPRTPDGVAAWEAIRRAAGQVRATDARVYALDFGAVLLLAAAMDALNPLLVEALPEIEPIVVRAYARDAD
ncbi:hypothetical protein [Pseudorhodoplanes sp.]|uniref:DUF7697 family protein n=1 Tax=Pseudorhodoplanes sp. TaxID=1934341 RepID=UPI0039199339